MFTRPLGIVALLGLVVGVQGCGGGKSDNEKLLDEFNRVDRAYGQAPDRVFGQRRPLARAAAPAGSRPDPRLDDIDWDDPACRAAFNASLRHPHPEAFRAGEGGCSKRSRAGEAGPRPDAPPVVPRARKDRH